jgi:threonine dehydratase
LAAATRESATLKGKRVALIATGGNVDRDIFAQVLSQASTAA